ncbi:Murein hydrolase activator NlpD precursor [Bacteroidales bacterium Barb6]|nr:Murein hydrolase activator NlpD precursor [Bacteroidales bacterium Barb6]
MTVKTVLSLCCISLFPLYLEAQEIIINKNTNSAASTESMDRHVSKLMADKVVTKDDIPIQKLIEINEKAALLYRESLLFPADELYDSHWDRKNVNPFKRETIDFPETYDIDCSSFVLPLTGTFKVTSKYGRRGRRMHSGTDLSIPTGDTVRAAFDGRVRIRDFERRGYGNYLVIRHPNGLETVYGHLSKLMVNEDDIVRAGDPIALSGNTGRSTGSHLHFETRFLGLALDPQALFDFENGVPHNDVYVFHSPKGNAEINNMLAAETIAKYSSFNKEEETPVANAPEPVYHKLRAGDTLGGIAVKYGTTVGKLCKLNGIKQTTILHIGRKIRVNG